MSTLTELRLLQPEPDGLRLIPVSPDAAAAALLGPGEAELRAAEEELRRKRDKIAQHRAYMAGLNPIYLHARHQDQSSLESVHDQQTVRALISDTVAQCRDEVLTCQSGGARPPAALAEALPRDLALLGRGVAMRTLYQHTARFHEPTREYIDQVIAAGSQVRTMDELPGQMIIVDRATAFLPDRAHEGGAVVVRDRALIEFLVDTFHQIWHRAIGYEPGPAAAQQVTDQTRRAILMLLADGLKDEVISRRLGISLRTCRRHIADMMEQIGATSRFQAGIMASQRGLTPNARDLGVVT
ncbi:helix-turn-helix transcriptional regulator [Longispora albida]|uniref:helix-turn-helix transcriptional regulator n=1 Tax=Longispora albida TaxID=203523 RepID=UPI0003724E1C|nr:LuxR C-terminal-related transcriptional regulator [Longispora albida]